MSIEKQEFSHSSNVCSLSKCITFFLDIDSIWNLIGFLETMTAILTLWILLWDFFSYWKSAFFLSKNLCRWAWCFWKYLFLRKLGEDLSFPFTWTLLQLPIVPSPHAWWAIKLLTYFPLKENFRRGECLCQKQNPSAVPSHSTGAISRGLWLAASQQHNSDSSALTSCNVNHLNGCFFKNTYIE